MTAQFEKDWTSMAFMEGWQGISPISPKRIWQHNLSLQNCTWTNHKRWNNIIWTDETKVEMCGQHAQCHVWRKLNTYHHKHLIPTVQHGGGGVMIWACFAATGCEETCSHWHNDEPLYTRIFLRQIWGHRSCNNRTMTRSTTKIIRKIWKRPSRSSDLNPTEMPWRELCRDECPHTSNVAKIYDFLLESFTTTSGTTTTGFTRICLHDVLLTEKNTIPD